MRNHKEKDICRFKPNYWEYFIIKNRVESIPIKIILNIFKIWINNNKIIWLAEYYLWLIQTMNFMMPVLFSFLSIFYKLLKYLNSTKIIL